jgi:hypothetical protein
MPLLKSLTMAFARQLTRVGFRKMVRKYTTDVTSETVITKTDVKDNYNILEKINIIQRWSTLSRRTKIAFGVYATIGLTNYAGCVYNDGKKALIAHRADVAERQDQNLSPEKKMDAIWNAVYNGCRKHRWEHFWDSLFFPYHFLSNAIPYVVIKNNEQSVVIKNNESVNDK